MENNNFFTIAQDQCDRICGLLDLDRSVREHLRHPMREFQFTIPVAMDDGRIKIFHGFRVQHNDARGPCKGGIRFHPHEDINIVRALAMWETWKCAAMDIPLGGAHGGVLCDPHNLSLQEQELLARGWVRCIVRNLGPHIDIPSPDIMTRSQHMLWMLDEYETLNGCKSPGMITGKPAGMGGSLGRLEAPGYGIVHCIREALKRFNLRPENTTASVQGFGTVAQYAVRLYEQLGGKVTCVSCWDQRRQRPVSYRRKNGIEFETLLTITDRFGGINQEKAVDLGYEVLKEEDWLKQEVDILIPAAIENQIRSDNVRHIHEGVKIIAEGANGPTTPEADEYIKSKNIFLIPDIIANAGGAICSYFEQVQSNINYYWGRDEVLGKIDIKITSAFNNICETAEKHKLYIRDAALMTAISKVAQCSRTLGWI